MFESERVTEWKEVSITRARLPDVLIPDLYLPALQAWAGYRSQRYLPAVS